MNDKEKLIADLKAKYGKIITITVPLDEDDETKFLEFHLRKPDMQVRDMIGKLAGKSVKNAVIAGYNALVVGGDKPEALLTNDDAFISASDALMQILEVQKATIKKN